MSNFDFTKTLLNGIKERINNISWNSLKDKPFGEVPIEIPITIEWDGDITDKIKFLEGQENGICYISDKVVNNYQELIGKNVQYYYDDTLYSITLDESMYSSEIYMDDIKGYEFRFKHGIDPATVFYNIRVITDGGELYGTQYESGIYLSFDHNHGNDYVALVEIGTGTREVIKIIDSKYLPEVSWNDLTDKPFDEKTTMSDTLIWNGNTEGLEQISHSYQSFYKVSDVALSLEDVQKECYYVDSQGNKGDFLLTDISTHSSTSYFSPNQVFVGFGSNMTVVIDKNNPEGWDTGIYFAIDTYSEVYITLFTIKGCNKFPAVELKTLDPKYLPEHSHSLNDLEGKPFGPGIVVNCIPEMTTTIGSDLWIEIVPAKDEWIIDGKVYKVVFNGEEYECTARYCSEYDSYLIGNGTIFEYDDITNDEPFLFVQSVEYVESYFCVLNEGTYTVSVSTISFEENFLPDHKHSYSWNDLTDKPFYDIERVATELIPETTISNFTEGEYYGVYYYCNVPTDYYVRFSLDKTYTVIWDNTIYEDVTCQDTLGGAMLGSSERQIAGAYGETNEYPFGILMQNIDGGYELCVASEDNQTHTVKVMETISKPQFKALDKKFIPSELMEEAKAYTDTEITTLSDQMLFVDVEDNEDVNDPYEGNAIVDSELSLESENPVQNKVVATEFEKVFDEIGGQEKRIDNLSKEIVDLQSVLSDGSKNVFDPSENTVNTALNQAFILSSGAIRNNGSGSDEGYFVTGKLSVEPNTKYTIKPNIWIEAVPSINRGRCYSSNDTALTALEWIKDNDGNYTFVSPPNTAYVRFSVHKETIGINNGANFEDIIALFNNIFSLTVGGGGSGVVSLIPDGSIKEHKLSEETSDKINKSYLVKDEVILNFGDSIFGNSRPPKDISTIIADYTKATVKNVAFGGCRMGVHIGHWDAFSMYRLAYSVANNDWSIQDDAINYEDRTSYAEQPLALLKETDFSKVNKITIGYGTNDFAGDNVLDNSENLYDTNTFAGALRYSIETILSAFPNIDIILLTPAYRFFMDSNGNFDNDSNTDVNSKGNTLIDFVDKVKEVGDFYNLHVVDLYNLGINQFNRSHYFPTTDGTHHNENGRKMIAKKIIHELY